MARIRLFHWNAEEAAPLLRMLQSAGHTVAYRPEFLSVRDARQSPPDAIVIDLTRRPAQGREAAISLRSSKTTRRIPIVFTGGEPEKVEAVHRMLPDAVYTPLARLRSAIRSALANPPADPVAPPPMMERYGSRTVAQKLGIGREARVAVLDPPPDYARAIGPLPEGAAYVEEPGPDCKLALWFVHDPAGFEAGLPEMRRLAARARLWIFWRKAGRSGGLNGNLIRAGANAFGLVDYKICSVNDAWSGMVFAVKKAR